MPHFHPRNSGLQIVGAVGQLCGGRTGPGSCLLPSQPPSTLPRGEAAIWAPNFLPVGSPEEWMQSQLPHPICNGRSQ